MSFKKLILFAVLCCSFSSCNHDKDDGAPKENYTILGPAGEAAWRFVAEYSDEFNGSSLDLLKWWPHNPEWTGREPGYFSPNNVTVSDGHLNIVMKNENPANLPAGYHTYTCGAVQSKRTIRYGYFEVRAQPMDSRGCSSFWFYKNESDRWTEIDVYEIGAAVPGMEYTVNMNAHVFRTPEDGDKHWDRHGEWRAPFKLADDFHVYGLEWSADSLKYFIEGERVRAIENTHWHQALTINFDCETMPDWFGLPNIKDLPSTYRIDYLRVWEKIE